MNLREAAQRALLALEFAYGFDIPHLDEHLDALDDLRTALAEPETEAETYERLYELRGKALERPCFHCGYKPRKIYPMEQRTEPEQEPVAWIHEDELPSSYPYDLMFPYSKVNGVRLFPVFGPFPQRKPLTDEEVDRAIERHAGGYDLSDAEYRSMAKFARAIERAHGIRDEA